MKVISTPSDFASLREFFRYPPKEMGTDRQSHFIHCLENLKKDFERGNFVERSRLMRKFGVLTRTIDRKRLKYISWINELAEMTLKCQREKADYLERSFPQWLPQPIMQVILTYFSTGMRLSDKDLLGFKTLKKVSKAFYHACERFENSFVRSLEAIDAVLRTHSYKENPPLTLKVEFDGASRSERRVFPLDLISHHHLEQVAFSSIDQNERAYLSRWFELSLIEDSCPTHLSIFCPRTEDFEQIVRFREIKDIWLGEKFQKSRFTVDDASRISRLPHLKRVSLRFASRVQHDPLDRIIQKLSGAKMLNHLSVTGDPNIYIEEDPLCGMLVGDPLLEIEKIDRLKRLFLPEWELSCPSCHRIANLKSLKELSVKVSSTECFDHLKLNQLNRLEILHLNGGFTEKQLASLSQLSFLQQLEIVDHGCLKSSCLRVLYSFSALNEFFWKGANLKQLNRIQKEAEKLEEIKGVECYLSVIDYDSDGEILSDEEEVETY